MTADIEMLIRRAQTRLWYARHDERFRCRRFTGPDGGYVTGYLLESRNPQRLRAPV